MGGVSVEGNGGLPDGSALGFFLARKIKGCSRNLRWVGKLSLPRYFYNNRFSYAKGVGGFKYLTTMPFPISEFKKVTADRANNN